MQEFGPLSFIGICTDHASNMVAAWSIVQEHYSHVIGYGCAAHAIELLAKDVCKLSLFHSTIGSNRLISKCFRRHAVPKSILQEYAQKLQNKVLVCLMDVPTRWSSVCKMLERNITLSNSIRLTLDDPRCHAAITASKSELLAERIRNSDFLQRTKFCVSVLTPMKHAIQEVEADLTKISVIPRVWNYMKQTITTAVLSSGLTVCQKDKEDLLNAFQKRRDFSIQPIHMAGNIIDPRFSAIDLTEQAKFGPVFQRPHIWNVTNEIDPLAWWIAHVNSRMLGTVAKTIFSMAATVACVERANKESSLQKTNLRNRLTNKRSATLTRVAYNHKLKQRRVGSLKIHRALDLLSTSNGDDAGERFYFFLCVFHE
jgi:hypothetical protein